MAFATVRTTGSPEFAAVFRKMQLRMMVRMQYETAMMIGKYVDALRLWSEHRWLRPSLAGPSGRLP